MLSLVTEYDPSERILGHCSLGMLSFTLFKHDSAPSPLCPQGSGPEPLSVLPMRVASPSEAPLLPGLLPLHAQGIHGRAELVESKLDESLSHGSLKAWRVAMDEAEASERNTVHTETLNPSSRCVPEEALQKSNGDGSACLFSLMHHRQSAQSTDDARAPHELGCSRVDAPLLCDSGTPVLNSTMTSSITQEHPGLSCIREAQERAEEHEGGLREWAAKAQLHQQRHEWKGSSCSVGVQHLHVDALEVLANLQVTLAAREQVITSKDAEIEHLKSRHQDVLVGVYVCNTHAHAHTQTDTRVP